MGAVFLVLASFLASGVEMVEALTIVLAMGLARDWRSSLTGAAAALVVLGVLVAVLGPALTLIPLDDLRLVVGALLLIFGLQWLRKAILRAAGVLALHDEDAIFREQTALAAGAAGDSRAGLDWYAASISFKGVLLEGTEVAFIVLTFGSTQGSIPLAAAGATAALVLVVTVGAVARHPLSRVPENTLKFAVGVMLTTFGTFWGAEGAGVSWPGGEVAILGVLAFTSARVARPRAGPGGDAEPRAGGDRRAVIRFGHFVYELVIGDDWRVAAGVGAAFAATWVLAHNAFAAWWVIPASVAVLLPWSLWRAVRRR